jgi:hypothetical protein
MAAVMHKLLTMAWYHHWIGFTPDSFDEASQKRCRQTIFYNKSLYCQRISWGSMLKFSAIKLCFMRGKAIP